MRLARFRHLWVAAAVGSMAAVSAVSAGSAEQPQPRVLAAGVHLGVDAHDNGVPSSPDRTLAPVVLAAVERAGGVDLAGGGVCPADRVALSWADPGPGWRSGGFIAPLGPVPTQRTSAVNGVVLCEGSHHAYVGFDALRTTTGWDVELVPDPAGGEAEEVGTNVPDAAPRLAATDAGWTGRARGAAIEGYPRYQGQGLCMPAAKPGTAGLRDLLLQRYRTTTSLGISRPCDVGGRSEHKEGRAFDWGANLGDPVQRAAAEDFLKRLLATDRFGNRHAMARRMGVMYVIWDHRMWSAYRADAGWRTYSGSSPHTDHVHLSLSWAGARGLTSFWSGNVVRGFPAAPTGGGASGAEGSSTAPRRSSRPAGATGSTATSTGSTATSTGDAPSRTTTRPAPSPSPTPSPAPSPTPTGGVLTPIEDGILDPLRPGSFG